MPRHICRPILYLIATTILIWSSQAWSQTSATVSLDRTDAVPNSVHLSQQRYPFPRMQPALRTVAFNEF